MNHAARGVIASAILVLSTQTRVLSGDTSWGSKVSTSRRTQNSELSTDEVVSQQPTPKPKPKPPTPKPQSQQRSCPKDVETLTALLIRDLPSYANRALQRASSRTKIPDYSTNVIVAGRPEFKPLSLGPGSYTPTDETAKPEEPRQVFFTTLERQYTARKAIQLQQYHWLFLTQASDGWRLVTMFSQIGPYPAGDPPSPPRESSNSFIGQGIRSWLEDCRAGYIRGLATTPAPQR